MPFQCTFNPDDPHQLALVLDRVRQEHGERVMEVREPTRSDSQNRRYWVAVVEPLADWLTATQGQQWTKLDVHEYLKASFLPQTERVDPQSGEVVLLPKSTTKLNKSDFSLLMEKGEALLDWLRDTYGKNRPVAGQTQQREMSHR